MYEEDTLYGNFRLLLIQTKALQKFNQFNASQELYLFNTTQLLLLYSLEIFDCGLQFLLGHKQIYSFCNSI